MPDTQESLPAPFQRGGIIQPTPPGPGHNSAGTWAERPIVDVGVASLTQAPTNPRAYSREDIAKATAIVRRVGLILPVLLDAEGLVIAGWLGGAVR